MTTLMFYACIYEMPFIHCSLCLVQDGCLAVSFSLLCIIMTLYKYVNMLYTLAVK